MAIQSFEQLEVWQWAHKIVLAVYRITQGFPTEEKYGLTAQMRRAAVSVPANVAEGFKRRGKADKRHFYNIAQGSLEELRYYFILCRDLGYKLDSPALADQADHIGRMLTGLIKSMSD
jgi:four helix bundle protein